MLSRINLCSIIAAAIIIPSIAQSSLASSILEPSNGGMRVKLPNGSYKVGKQLVGGEIIVVNGRSKLRLKVKSAKLDPADKFQEIILYDLVLTQRNHKEQYICKADPHGDRAAIIIAGQSNLDGTISLLNNGSFEIACLAGFQAKCVRLGYAPWRITKDGEPMLDWFNSCVRMFRADYCGDGKHYTKNGTVIEFSDSLGINKKPENFDFKFEAAWGPHGAVCAAKPRINSITNLEDLRHSCPRLKDHLGPAQCSNSEKAYIINYSKN